VKIFHDTTLRRRPAASRPIPSASCAVAEAREATLDPLRSVEQATTPAA